MLKKVFFALALGMVVSLSVSANVVQPKKHYLVSGQITRDLKQGSPKWVDDAGLDYYHDAYSGCRSNGASNGHVQQD